MAKAKETNPPLDQMTLKDFFAAFALMTTKGYGVTPEEAARRANEIAEAMIKDRQK